MLEELLPAPVLAVGLTGHREISTDDVAISTLVSSLTAVFEALRKALPEAVTREAAYFTNAAPIVRLVTMGAEGTDQVGAGAALSCGLKVAYIFPFAWEEYRGDFSPSSLAKAKGGKLHASSLLELPGTRSEGPRAYERANNVILANVDLLVAVWDGKRARGRAGTGDVVQDAVAKGTPVIVIDPAAAGTPMLLVVPAGDIDPPEASDLLRKAFPNDAAEFVHDILRPPASLTRREGLIDLLAETPGSTAWRFEYPLLLKAAGGATRRQPLAADRGKPPSPANTAVAVAARTEVDANAERLDRARQTIDQLAVRYGRLFRSSTAGQYLYVILGIWLSGFVGILFPAWASFSIALQLAANIAVLTDVWFRVRHRWQERWLDYRVVAERLRWLRFQTTLGLGNGDRSRLDVLRNTSWTNWYIRRVARSLGPPRGKIDAASLADAVGYLTETEIPEQIRYHRQTFRQLGILEQRLLWAARLALFSAVGVAAALAVAGLMAGGLDDVGWKPLAIVLLGSLPSTMTALNGLRVDADLVRLIERSAQTVALLSQIKRGLLAAAPDYDHVVPYTERLASIMRNELAEWRMVIENRRSRAARRKLQRRRHRWH